MPNCSNILNINYIQKESTHFCLEVLTHFGLGALAYFGPKKSDKENS